MEKSIPFLIGMAWYYREDYDAILRIMTDSHMLPGSFEVWLAEAEQGEQQLKRDGYTVVRAHIDPETFPDWCRSRDLDIDSQARMDYANFVAKGSTGSDY